jgi:hypothetical protein
MVKDDQTSWLARFGGWAGAVGAIAQAEYLRAPRQNRQVNVQINLIGNTALQFDPLVQQYIKLALEKNPNLTDYYDKRIDDPRMERMIDLKTIPMSHWPSSDVYHAFNEYLFTSIMLMETSADEDTSIKLQDRITVYGRKFETLKKALDASQR